MTISTTTSRVRLAADGTSTDFVFPYYFEKEDHLAVFLSDSGGSEVLQILASDYMVAGAGEETGGMISFVVSPSAGEFVTIIRRMPLTQSTEADDVGTFRQQAFEKQFDRHALQAQSLQEQIDRAVKLKPSSAHSGPDFPDPEAGMAIAWNAAGDALENAVSVSDIAGAAGSAADAAMNAAQAAGSAAAAAISADAAETAESDAASSAVAASASAMQALNAVALKYTFSGETVVAGPGDGAIRFDNGSPGAVTELVVDDVDAYGNDISTLIDSWGTVSASVKATLTLRQLDDITRWGVFHLNAVVANTGYRTLSVTTVATGLLPQDGAALALTVAPHGSDGGIASVNGQTGAVTLDADDIDDSTTANRFASEPQLAKVDYLSVTQPVDLDQLETDVAALGAVPTPEMFGAVGDGSTDDTTALQSFFDAVTGSGYTGLKGEAHGKTYRITDTITITGNNASFDFHGVLFRPDDTVTTAFRFGKTAAILQNCVFRGVRIEYASYDDANDTIAFLLENTSSCIFEKLQANKTDYGFVLRPQTGGSVSYCEFIGIRSTAGTVNIWLDPQGTGFANENHWFGGRLHTEADGTMTASVLIESGCNGNALYGISAEGEGQNSVLCHGRENVFADCRVEGIWSDVSIRLGSSSLRNYVRMMRNDVEIIDAGVDNIIARWQDGAGVGTFRVLAASAVAVSHTGNTNEITLGTITVPGGLMGPNGVLRIWARFSWNNDADAKTARIKFGGSISNTFYGGANQQINAIVLIQNRNSENSQISGTGTTGTVLGITGNGFVSMSKNTASNVDLQLTGQLADSADMITLENYVIEVLYQS